MHLCKNCSMIFYSHLYIIVVISDSVIDNVEEILTKDILEKSNGSFPLYYMAAVYPGSW